MKIRIQQRAYNKWPGDVRRRLMSLTFRDWSGMREAVHSGWPIITLVLFENNNPVAWSLIRWDRFNKIYDIMIYVRRNRRYLGYGRRLFTQAKRWVNKQKKKHFIHPDGINNGFWKKMGEKI